MNEIRQLILADNRVFHNSFTILHMFEHCLQDRSN